MNQLSFLSRQEWQSRYSCFEMIMPCIWWTARFCSLRNFIIIFCAADMTFPVLYQSSSPFSGQNADVDIFFHSSMLALSEPERPKLLSTAFKRQNWGIRIQVQATRKTELFSTVKFIVEGFESNSKNSGNGLIKDQMTLSKTWSERLDDLSLWKRNHGHCCVPKAQGALGRFVFFYLVFSIVYCSSSCSRCDWLAKETFWINWLRLKMRESWVARQRELKKIFKLRYAPVRTFKMNAWRIGTVGK